MTITRQLPRFVKSTAGRHCPGSRKTKVPNQDDEWRLECLKDVRQRGPNFTMSVTTSNQAISDEKLLHDRAVIATFLETPSEATFGDLFQTFSPQVLAFFRARGCALALAEDLAQEVMLTVYRKAAQIRDRALFRAWLFKIARNALCRHYGKQARQVETVNLTDVTDHLIAATSQKAAGTPAFEFLHWMAFLDSQEGEAMKLRFIEQWEYHEIAAAQDIPIGTVQWRVFNAKKKLAPFLTTREQGGVGARTSG
jgi:RNA polymerase sigma-70 factor (ECF subfamily)